MFMSPQTAVLGVPIGNFRIAVIALVTDGARIVLPWNFLFAVLLLLLLRIMVSITLFLRPEL
jgi:hypothetical protein